jgi:transposase InsO family protein
MKNVCDALGVSRSGQYESQSRPPKLRERYRKKPSDTVLLDDIQAILAVRPACGYRAVTAHLNRQRLKTGKPGLNHKYVYRLMRAHGLLLPKGSSRVERAHEGKIAVSESDTRWCSDGFEIPCFNGEKVRVAFSLDCCDRDILAYVATTTGITGHMIRDLMVLSLEARFPQGIPRQNIEWLTDNGSCYIDKETTRFGRDIGLVPIQTAVRSPESNGMAESFVRTFKRAYVAFGDLEDPSRVMAQLPKWFMDYRLYHPHSALGWKSPSEFRALRENRLSHMMESQLTFN